MPFSGHDIRAARPLGKTKKATLAAIAKTALGTKTDRELNSQVLVDYALWRMSPEGGGVKPQTVGNDLAHLGAVLSVARPAWGYEVDGICMVEARRVLSKLGYRLKSQERDRRPTMAELDKLFQRFQEVLRPRPSSIHMPKSYGVCSILNSPPRGDKGEMTFSAVSLMKPER